MSQPDAVLLTLSAKQTPTPGPLPYWRQPVKERELFYRGSFESVGCDDRLRTVEAQIDSFGNRYLHLEDGWLVRRFGKGVYLADVSTKSANYCNPGMSGNVGLLLLCEVELSQPMYEIPTGNSNAQQEAEKNNCISTMGVGRTAPQAWKDAGCVHESLKGVLMVCWNIKA